MDGWEARSEVFGVVVPVLCLANEVELWKSASSKVVESERLEKFKDQRDPSLVTR